MLSAHFYFSWALIRKPSNALLEQEYGRGKAIFSTLGCYVFLNHNVILSSLWTPGRLLWRDFNTKFH